MRRVGLGADLLRACSTGTVMPLSGPLLILPDIGRALPIAMPPRRESV
jgi:hypothetical protein